MKTCRKCNVEKPTSEFWRDASRSDGLQNQCAECKRAWNNAHYAKNREARVARQKAWYWDNHEQAKAMARDRYHRDPEKTKKQVREWYWSRKYGLTPEDYNAMLDAQNHRCKICGTPGPVGRGWCVDHCHASGKVRAILCSNCNNGLGHFQDSPEILAAARAYVLEHAG